MRDQVGAQKTQVLVVDDEEGIRHLLRLLLTREGFEVEVAEDAMEALGRLEQRSFDIALCDIRMPGELDGLGFLDALRERGMPCDVVMMSAYGSRETALKAVRRGAYDYVDKPFQPPDDLLLTLRKLLERKHLDQENRHLRAVLREASEDCGIVTKAESMRALMTRARKVAQFPSSVLILGETGTGKSLMARAMHRWSHQADGAFQEVNCGAIPANLLESELFGYARGAFTGANRDHKGLILEAHEGTLFLDEIGELSLELQVKLLRVLEEQKLRRLGETTERQVELRLLSATNKDLWAEVQAGRFREDLYHRVVTVQIALPRLRDRLEDLPLLVETYIARFNASYKTQIKGVSAEAMRTLMAYHWPGNIRELKNVVESSMVQEESDTLTVSSLPERVLHGPSGATTTLDADEIYIPPHLLSIKKVAPMVEELLIRRALEQTEGNRSAAARLVEISHRALLYKIKDYGID